MEPNRVVESLHYGADALERAETGAEVRSAIRDGLLGLEYHLDTLARELQRDPAHPGAIDPAMRPRAERVEETLRGLLLKAWEMLAETDTVLAASGRAREFAAELRAADSAEIALVFDRLLTPNALD